MTLEKRVVFSPQDIKSIKLSCDRCSHEAAWVSGGKTERIPDRCPWCGLPWSEKNEEAWQRLTAFLKFVTHELPDPERKKNCVSILIEVEQGEKP